MINKNSLLSIIFLFAFNISLFSQNEEEILLTIHDREITKEEFLRIYRKNNRNIDAFDQKSIEEYLELFINFKLKVIEAEELGLDTTQVFINEFGGYRKQLAKPYLTSGETDEELLLEAYERSKLEIKASHILIRMDMDATSDDTLFTYNKALNIRTRILEGEDFTLVAKGTSDDPSVKNNGGNLGYFTAFQMIYPFETAAYETDSGEISMPVRTRFGYHIVKVTDKRTARGQIKAAHIYIAVPQGVNKNIADSARERINNIYEMLINGADFTDLAGQYSEDPGTANNGGELPWFGGGRMMVEEFENAAFALQDNGDISKPVRTIVGWHIIKRLDKKDIQSFEEMKSQLNNQISRSDRSEIAKTNFIHRLKNEYEFIEYPDKLADFYNVVDNSVFSGSWDVQQSGDLEGTIFSLAGINYTQQDFARYIAINSRKRQAINIQQYIDEMYEKFISESVIQYEEDRLENKYPEFKYLLSEYHDGILLFELTDRMVWSRAIEDTLGLKSFYENNMSNYLDGERIDVTIYECFDEKTVEKARKMLDIKGKSEFNNEDILEKINKRKRYLDIKEGIFSKGENDLIDKISWKKGLSDNIEYEDKVVFVKVNAIDKPVPKTLEEARGIITADYQTYLEQIWIDKLRSKYKITINSEALSKINQDK